MDQSIVNFVESVRARNWRESIAAVIIILYLGYRLYADPQGLSPVGAWIVIVACLGIIALAWGALNIPASEPTTHPLEQHSDHWRRRMTTQATALRFAWLWYVLPLLGGVAVILASREEGMSTRTMLSLGVVAAVGVALSYANWNAANRMEKDRDALFGAQATTTSSA